MSLIKAITYSLQQENLFSWFRNEDGKAAKNVVVKSYAGTGKTFSIVTGMSFAPEVSAVVTAFNTDIVTEVRGKLIHQPGKKHEARSLNSLAGRFMRVFGQRATLDTTDNCTFERVKIAREAWLAWAGLSPVASFILSGEGAKLIVNCVNWIKSVLPLAKTTEEIEGAIISMVFETEAPDDAPRHIAMIVSKVFSLTIKDVESKKPFEYSWADQVWLPVRLELIKPSYDLIVVDEFQDLSPVQLIVIQRIVRPNGRICLVGDPYQSIYSFRGASKSYADDMTKRLNAQELRLSVTYRCPKAIVKHANQWVADYEAHQDAPEGVIEKKSFRDMLAGAQNGDFILSRTNAPLMSVCLKLIARKQRARIAGRSVGETLMNRIRKIEKDRKVKFYQSSDLLVAMTEWFQDECERIERTSRNEAEQDSRIEAARDILEVFRSLCEEFAEVDDIRDALLTLFADKSDIDPATCVTLSSIHKSKGLERQRVWVLENTFTHEGSEENNLKYISATRARSSLFLVRGLPDDSQC